MSDSAPDKDLPLREDIRLLGRLLGDTVRDQEGDAVFDLIERIRQTSIPFHRDDDIGRAPRTRRAPRRPDARPDQIVVRAFSYFSHLANIAEDQHHIRRARAHLIAGSAPREGSLSHALDRCARSRPCTGIGRRLLRQRAGGAGAHRPPDRGPAQEHPRLPRGRSPACSKSATACS